MKPGEAFKAGQLWIPMLVRNAYVFALQVDRVIPAKIGPDGDRAHYPDSADFTEERLKPTRDDITHSEYVLVGYRAKDGSPRPAWLNGAVLGYPQQRETLRRWGTWASFGKMHADGIGQTDEQFANDILHISDLTMRRRIDFACQVIANALNEASLPVWYVEKPKRKENRHVTASV